MVKTELNQTPKVVKNLQYPVLAKAVGKHLGYVVLFTDKGQGTVLVAGKASYKVGEFIDCWIDVHDIGVWEILPTGTTVTITQG